MNKCIKKAPYYSFKDQYIMEGMKFSTKYLLKPEAEALLMEQIMQLHKTIELEKENNQLIFKKGEKEIALAIAKAMVQESEPIEKIICFTGLSESDIQKLY